MSLDLTTTPKEQIEDYMQLALNFGFIAMLDPQTACMPQHSSRLVHKIECLLRFPSFLPGHVFLACGACPGW